MRLIKLFLILLFAPLVVLSQQGSPDDYYDDFNFNLSPSELKTALANLITSTSNLQSYSTAWEALKISDLAEGSSLMFLLFTDMMILIAFIKLTPQG